MRVIDCPKCKGAAADITPLKKKDERIAIYGCTVCGYAFTSDGKAFVKDGEALRDVFRGATQGNDALVDMLAGTGEVVNGPTRALLAARMLEYGLQMWMDGVKQGILLGVMQDKARERDGKVRSEQSDPPRRAEEQRGHADAGDAEWANGFNKDRHGPCGQGK